MQLLSAFSLSHGRLSRSAWLCRLLASSLLCAAFAMPAAAIAGESGQALFAALFVWSAGALSLQRLHDIGRTGPSLLVVLVPVLGPLALLVFLCRRGAQGGNAHGPDPLARHDYARVNIDRCPQ
jgi:uncharacterized membrane protein YhaH (DUF805 family)